MSSTTEAVAGGGRPAAIRPSESFDVIVIGAGINGAGIAQDAAARGLRVALIERDDIGSGTSNWSGRLIHGGLRYLEQGDVRLVRESLRERERLFRLAPHLVKPVPVTMPFYSYNRRPKWMVRVGMLAYDVLSYDKSTVSHTVLSREATLKRNPGLNAEGLDGSAVFMDGQVIWSERLCVEVVLAAHADGAKIYTHCEVNGLVGDADQVAGVRYTDRITGESGALGAKIVINAAGPWVDAVLAHDGRTKRRHIGGTKGSHAVVAPFPGAPSDVVYYESQADGRLVLVIPWGRHYLIGTTDQRFEGDPEAARADTQEISYLLGEVNRLIPQANLKLGDVLYTYSGVRPLPFNPGKSEWNVPRSHVIHDHAPEQRGLLSIIGGKLTTYRSLAQDAVDVVFKQLAKTVPKCTTASRPFPGARTSDWAGFRADLVERSGLDEAIVEHLVSIYGTRAADIIALGRSDPALLERIDNSTNAIGAEIAFTFEREFARTLTDVLFRRTTLTHNAALGLNVVERAADILAARHGWDRARRDQEVAEYRHYVERFMVPDEGAAPATAPSPTEHSARAA